MQTEHLFVRDEVAPSWWANAIGYFLSLGAFGFQLTKQDATHIEVLAGASTQAAAVAVAGRWRWIEATITRAHPGGAAGTYDIFVTAAETSIVGVPAPYTDTTNYAFALAIVTAGATPAIVAGVVDIYRKVGSLQWDGAQITRIDQTVPAPPRHKNTHATGQPDALAPADIGALPAAGGIITGALEIQGAGTGLTVDHDATVTGVLTIGGNATVGGTLGVTGATTVAGLTATGAVALNGAAVGLSVANNATVGGTLAVTGTSTLAAINANGAYTQAGAGANTFTGATTFSAAGTALSVTNNATINGTLTLAAATASGLITANGGLTLGDAQNIAVGTVTGTKIGTTALQKLGFYGKAPVAQPANAGAYTNNTGLALPANRTLPASFTLNQLTQLVLQLISDLGDTAGVGLVHSGF